MRRRELLSALILAAVVCLWGFSVFQRMAPHPGTTAQASVNLDMAARFASVGLHGRGLPRKLRRFLVRYSLDMLVHDRLRRRVVKGERVDASRLKGWFRLQARANAGAAVQAELARRAQRDQWRLLALALWLGGNGVLGVLAVLAWPWLRRRLPPSVAHRNGASFGIWRLVAAVLLWNVFALMLGTVLITGTRAWLGATLALLLGQAVVYAVGFALFRGWLELDAGPPAAWKLGLGLVGFWACVPLVFLASQLTGLLTGMPPRSTNPVLEMLVGASALRFGLLVLLVVVLGPAFEEFFFRGVLFANLSPRIGRGWAAAASALVFALVHGDLMGVLPLFVLGLVFAWLAAVTESLWPSTLAHSLWNLYTVVLLWLAR